MSDPTAFAHRDVIETVVTTEAVAAVVASHRPVAELAAALGMEYTELVNGLYRGRKWFVSELAMLAIVLGTRLSTWLVIAERIADLNPGTEVWFRPAAMPTSARVGRVVEVDVESGAVKLVEQSGRIHWAQPQDVLEVVADELPVDDEPIEYLPVTDEQRQAHESAVNDGRACTNCGKLWAVGEPSRPCGVSATGSQLFRCTPACAAVAR